MIDEHESLWQGNVAILRLVECFIETEQMIVRVVIIANTTKPDTVVVGES